MKGIQERRTKDGKIHYRVQVRIKGHPVRAKDLEELDTSQAVESDDRV